VTQNQEGEEEGRKGKKIHKYHWKGHKMMKKKKGYRSEGKTVVSGLS